MSLFSLFFKKKKPSLQKKDKSPKTSGELISEVTDEANLVDGKQTWELAEEKKDDLEAMKRCCDAELKTMDKAGVVPAPYYFERVAILSRKIKDYQQEIFYCEQYIKRVESFYSKNGAEGVADVRKGPRFKAIVKRLPKARELYAKGNLETPKLTVLSDITNTIEVPKSGKKGKFAFLNSRGEACSTEDAFKDYMEQQNWKVMRAEVSFWQAMFCLSFWEEIFDGMGNPKQGADIPLDLFRLEEFYSNRKALIDRKFEFINKQNLQSFINDQIKKYRNHWTRLIYDGDQNLIAYSETDIVQSFLKRIDTATFAKVVYRIAKNPNENRAGVSDFVIWNNHELKMIEVKKIRERVRESQQAWIYWMLNNDIPTEIVKVKGV